MTTFFKSAQAMARNINRMPIGSKLVSPGAANGYATNARLNSTFSPFKQSTLLANGYGSKGFLAARAGANRGFATNAAKVSKRNASTAVPAQLTRAEINARRFDEAISADGAVNPRLFGNEVVNQATRRYRMGGLAAFCMFICVAHPVMSMNALRTYRAWHIRGEDHDYMRGKTNQMIQDEVAGRHKTTTKFRVLKNMTTNARALHRGPGQVGRNMHGNPSNGGQITTSKFA
jgi:hypothetical protein